MRSTLRTTISMLVALLACGSSFGASVPREARLFTVDALVDPPVEWGQPMPEKGPIIANAPDTDDSYGPGVISYSYYGEEPEVRAKRVTPAFEGDALVEVIRTFIAEDSWSNERNAIRLMGGKLRVVQTPAVLAEIEGFLEILYARSMARYALDIAFVPPEAFAEVRGEDARELPPDVLDRARMAGGASASFFRTLVAEGERPRLEPVALRSAVVDLDVNQTGTVPAVNSVVGGVRDGLAFEGCVRKTPHEERLELDYSIGIDETGKDRGVRRTQLGDLDLPRTGGAVLSGAGLVTVGRTIVLGEFKAAGPTPRSFTALARVRVVQAGAATPSPVGIIEVGALLQPRSAKPAPEREPQGPFVSDPSRRPPVGQFDADELLAKVRAALPSALRREERLKLHIAGTALFVKVLGSPEDTERASSIARGTVRKLFEEVSRVVEMRIWHGSIEEAALAPVLERESGTVLLAKAWRSRLALERETSIRLAGYAGRDLRLWAGDGRRYVADTEQVSGGTTHEITEVTDPIVRWAGSGLELRASASPVPGTPWVQLLLRGAVATTEFKRSLAVRVDRSMSVDRDGTVRPIGAMMEIDLPDQKADRWDHFVAVPAGRAVLLNSLPDPTEPGKMRILVVETRL